MASPVHNPTTGLELAEGATQGHVRRAMVHGQEPDDDIRRPARTRVFQCVPARIGAVIAEWFKTSHEESCRPARLEALEGVRLARFHAKRQPRRERVL
jgi:hypothetical protein